ncbi:hypothetical protein ACOME3_002103 [Neoechinorhynchus agilis]
MNNASTEINGQSFSSTIIDRTMIDLNCTCKNAVIKVHSDIKPNLTLIDKYGFNTSAQVTQDGVFYIAEIFNASNVKEVKITSSDPNNSTITIRRVIITDCANMANFRRPMYRIAGGYWLHPVVWIIFLSLLMMVFTVGCTYIIKGLRSRHKRY